MGSHDNLPTSSLHWLVTSLLQTVLVEFQSLCSACAPGWQHVWTVLLSEYLDSSIRGSDPPCRRRLRLLAMALSAAPAAAQPVLLPLLLVLLVSMLVKAGEGWPLAPARLSGPGQLRSPASAALYRMV